MACSAGAGDDFIGGVALFREWRQRGSGRCGDGVEGEAAYSHAVSFTAFDAAAGKSVALQCRLPGARISPDFPFNPDGGDTSPARQGSGKAVAGWICVAYLSSKPLWF